jgi:uncharacterized protein
MSKGCLDFIMGIEWLLYPLAGIAAGLMAGLLGVGGGLVLVPALIVLLPMQGVPDAVVMQVALATSLTSIFFTGLSSTYAHHRRGALVWPAIGRLVPGLLLGASLGGMMAVQLSSGVLKIIVAIFCMLVGLQMLLNKSAIKTMQEKKPNQILSAWGVLIGGLSSLVGIGGGSLTVPLLISRGYAPVNAVASSSACGIVIALSAALTYALQNTHHIAMPGGVIGYVHWPAALLIALASIPAAPFGAKLAHALPAEKLKRVFAVFLLVVGVMLFLKG